MASAKEKEVNQVPNTRDLLPSDIWELAGYPREALEQNRRGLIHPSQRAKAYPAGSVLPSLFFVLFPIGFGWALITSPGPKALSFVLMMTAVLGMFEVAGIWLSWSHWKGRRDGKVQSVCGPVTKWAENDGGWSRGLRLADGRRFLLTERGYHELPEGHYRVYYVHSGSVSNGGGGWVSGNVVVNVDDHVDDECFEGLG